MATSINATPVAAFIREHTDEILECWESSVRTTLVHARALDHKRLLDHLPLLLGAIADMIDRMADHEDAVLSEDVADRHARTRLEQGYGLSQVVQEYALLRACLTRQWEQSQGPEADHIDELAVMHRAIDQAISASVERYARAAAGAIDSLDETARRATQLREQVLAIVSHDLRSPLAAMRLAATVLERTVGTDARARKPLDAIMRSTTRMEHLINDLLDLGTMQVGMLRIDAKPLELEWVLQEAVAAHTPIAAEKGIALALDSNLRDARVRGDFERLVQALTNLIGNAIKFCKTGDTITVRGEWHDDTVRVAVADGGPGIAEADMAHLFEQYWSANRHARNGAGLGLYICKGIVEAHGGSIWVESTPGEGSTFTFELPKLPG